MIYELDSVFDDILRQKNTVGKGKLLIRSEQVS